MRSRIGPACILVLCIISIYFVLQLKIDNRQDRMLDQSGPEALDHKRFQEAFGNDDVVIIAISGKPLFDEDALDVMVQVMDLLEDNPYVEDVTGIPALYRENFGEEDPEALEEEMTSTPFYQGLFISANHDVAGLLVQSVVLDTPDAFKELSEHILTSLQPLRDYGFRVDAVGGVVFDTAINTITLGESMRMFPIAAVASLLVLIALLRSFKATAVVLICGCVTELLTLGALVALGRTMTIVTSALPLILWVLTLANCIHLVNHYQRHLAETSSIETAIRETLSALRFSCSLAAITTAFGFLSLVVADIGLIRELGAFMALGMLISLGVNLVLCPYLLNVMKVPAPDGAGQGTSRVPFNFGDWVHRYPRIVGALVGAVIIWGAYSATQLRTEADATKFLPKDGELIRSYDFVAENLTGLHTLEIMFDTPGGWLNPEYWAAIDDIAADLETSEVVARVYTPYEFLKKTNQWDHDFDTAYYALPETREEAEKLIALLSEEDDNQLPHFVTEDGQRIRMSVLINTMEAQHFATVVDRGREHIARLDPPLSATVTGMATRMQAMQLSLIMTQIKSFSLAFVLVFVSILIGLRSVRLTLLTVIPNVMPLLSVFATMAVLDIPLNAGTVMVASISLGIAVDDTVHFIVGYHRHRVRGQRKDEAIRSTLSKVGPSLIATTITACIGFFTLSQSAFPPISNFGLLAGIAIVVALLADIFLVPAIFALRNETA